MTSTKDVGLEQADAPPSKGAKLDAFVSYARVDLELDPVGGVGFIDRVLADLAAAGKDVWIDRSKIEPAAEWRARIARGIEAAKSFVFVITPRSVNSVECMREIDDAVTHHKRIIPLVLRAVPDDEVPEALRALNWIHARPEDDHAVAFDQLIDALESDLEWRDAHARLATRTREWLDHDEDNSYLLRGSDLKRAEDWYAQKGGHREQPTDEQYRYIAASRQAASRRQRTLVGALALGLTVALGLAGFALIQRSQARHQASVATSREFAARADAELATEPENSIALAAQGVRTEPTTQAIHALSQALDSSRLRTQIKLTSGVESVVFSPDGALVAVGADNGTVQLWRLYDRHLLWIARLGSVPATALAFSPDGGLLAVAQGAALASSSGPSACSVALLSARTATIVRTINKVSSALRCRESVAFLAATNVLEVGQFDGTVQLFDPSTGRLLDTVTGARVPATNPGVPGFVFGLGFSADGRLVGTAGNDGWVRIVALPSGQSVMSFNEGSPSSLLFKADAIAFSPDDREAVVGSELETEIFQLRPQVVLGTLRGGFGFPQALAWSPDGRLVAAGLGAGTTLVWSATSDRLVEALAGGSSQSLTSVAFSSTGMLTAGSLDGSVRVWSPDPDLPVRTLTSAGGVDSGAAPFGHLAVFPGASSTILADDRGAEVGRLNVSAAAVGADGYIAVQAGDRLEVLKLPSGRLVRSWALSPNGSFDNIAISADGRVAATVTRAGQVTLYSARPPMTTAVSPAPGSDTPQVSLSPDGRIVVVAGAADPAATRILNADDLRVIRTEPGSALTFSPDGSAIAIQRPDYSIAVLRTSDWRLHAVLLGASAVTGLGFSPDGRLLGAGGEDGVLRVWDAADGTLLSTRTVTELSPETFGTSLGISPPVLTAAGYAIVSSNYTPTLGQTPTIDIYDVCSSCLNRSSLLQQSDARLHEITPVTGS